MGKSFCKASGLLVLIMSVALCPLACADNSAAEIKVAFIYNFAKFVEWPPTSFAAGNNALHVCLWGDSVLENKLHLLDGRIAQGRTINVKSLASNHDGQGCHIVVVGGGSDAQRQQMLTTVATSSVLTISDSPGFIQQGGMISLFVAANRVQFSVNLTAAQSSGLKLSARMLQLAAPIR